VLFDTNILPRKTQAGYGGLLVGGEILSILSYRYWYNLFLKLTLLFLYLLCLKMESAKLAASRKGEHDNCRKQKTRTQ
jgi:hypothetical protein